MILTNIHSYIVLLYINENTITIKYKYYFLRRQVYHGFAGKDEK